MLKKFTYMESNISSRIVQVPFFSLTMNIIFKVKLSIILNGKYLVNDEIR